VLQVFDGLTEILKNPSVEKLHLPHCARHKHQSWNVIDRLTPRELARSQSLFDPLAIFDVHIGSVPLDDLPQFVSQWIGQKQEPAICAVETSHARFSFDGHARSQG